MKLYLASENFYVKVDDKESTGLLIAASTPTIAHEAATFSWLDYIKDIPDPRSTITPNFDIIELGSFVMKALLKDRLKLLPEMKTGGVTLLSFYEDPGYSKEDMRLREIIAARFDPLDKPFAYTDELKRIRGAYFSFHPRVRWRQIYEIHFGLKVDVWVSPDYQRFCDKTIMKENDPWTQCQ